MYHSSIRKVIVAFVVAVWAVASPVRSASAAVAEVTFPDVAADYAVDPQSGHIAAVDPERGKVVLYGPELAGGAAPKPIASVDIAGKPFSVVFKQVKEARTFVVGCKTEKSLYLLDAATLKQTGKIEIAGSQVATLSTALDPDDPYVYYFYENRPTNTCARANVVKRLDEGDVLERGLGTAYDGAISARGNYLCKRGSGSPPGLECFEKVEPITGDGKARFHRVHDGRGGGFRYICDPFETLTACGPMVFTANLGTQLYPRLSFEVRCFSDAKPWLAGIESPDDRRRYSGGTDKDAGGKDAGGKGADDGFKLIVASTNTLRPLAELPLPEFFTRGLDKNFLDEARHAYGDIGSRVTMFADSARSRILVFRGDRALVVPTADLKLADEPLLVVRADTRTPLVAWRKNVVELALKDPRTKVELLDKPDGLELVANRLEWTPKSDVVGAHPVRLKLSIGEFERTETLKLQVDGPFTPLPAIVNRLNLSDDGRSLVAWRNSSSDFHEMMASRNGNKPGQGPQCALIDPIEQKVLAVAAVPFITEVMTADAHFVYGSQVNTGVVTVLDRADLSVKNQITLDGKISWIRGVDNKALVVGLGDGRWVKYSVPDFKPVAEHRLAMPAGRNAMHMGSGYYPPMQPVADGWRTHSGDVFDKTFSKLLLAKSVGDLLAAGRHGFFEPVRPDNHRVRVGHSERADEGEEGIVNVARFGSPEKMVVLLRKTRRANIAGSSGNYGTEGIWSLQDRSQPLEGRRIMLSSSYLGQSYIGNDGMTQRSAMLATKDRLITAFDGKVFQTPLSEILVDGENPPAPAPEIKQIQSTFIADAAGKTTLKHELVGGKLPAQFALTDPYPGVMIDPTDGTVTIDGPAVTKGVIDELCGTAEARLTYEFVNGNSRLNSGMLWNYLAKGEASYEALAGKKPTGVPVALMIGVQATDSTPRIATTSYYVVLDLPRPAVDERMAAVEVVVAKAREAFLAEQRKQSRQMEIGGERRNPDVSPETQAYIRRLQERIATLETQLNILSKMLKK